MEAVENEEAADERVLAEVVNDPGAWLLRLENDLEDSFEASAVQVHERLHQLFYAGTQCWIGNGFQILNQLTDLLYSLLEVLLVDHSSPQTARSGSDPLRRLFTDAAPAPCEGTAIRAEARTLASALSPAFFRSPDTYEHHKASRDRSCERLA